MLFGVCGKLGSGKDFFATHVILDSLREKGESCLHLNLADQIKTNVMTKQNISYDDVYHTKTKDTRRLLQSEGTENGRNLFGNDIWIKYFDNWKNVFMSRGISHIICTDIRFKNELAYFKENNAFLIKIIAPELNNERLLQESQGDPHVLNTIQTHISECDLDDIPNSEFNLVIHNHKNKDIHTLYSEFTNAYSEFMNAFRTFSI